MGPTDASPRWQIPRLRRDDAWIAGVSGAIAYEVGIPVWWVRASWIALVLVGGWGVPLYLAAWAFLSWAEIAGQAGDAAPIAKGRDATWRGLGFACVMAGAMLLCSTLPGLPAPVCIGLVIVIAGIVVVRKALETSSLRLRRRGWASLGLSICGIAIAALGVMVMAFGVFGTGATAAIVAISVALAFLMIAATSPWWWGAVRRVDAERLARTRADERAAVAAHLHDSVLQTLTLIQRDADDPSVVTRLARRQERELRNWLDPRRASRVGRSLKGHLDELSSDIEDHYDLRVEAVVVGDVLVDDQVVAIVDATREAIVNVAKHAEVTTVDLYAQVSDDAVEVFVRDRGTGFDPTSETERIGIRDSIRGRLHRVGGTAVITSRPGEGTEVELCIPRAVITQGGA